MKQMYQGPAALPGDRGHESILSSAEEAIYNEPGKRDSYFKATPEKQGLKYTPQESDYVKTLEETFVEPTNRSILWDRIMFFNANWFGNARVFRTSRYDDIANGVDLLVEFQDDDGNVIGALGLDTTVCDKVTLGEKYKKIYGDESEGKVGKLDKGKLADLQHRPMKKGKNLTFQNEGEIPQIILAISPDFLMNFAKGKYNEEQVKLIALEEILVQLDVERQYIEGANYDAGLKEKLIEKINAVSKLVEIEKEKSPLQQGVTGIEDETTRYATSLASIMEICPNVARRLKK